jgi:N-acetylneuraminic acid mutarotase
MTYGKIKVWIEVLVLILAVPVFNSCKDEEKELVGNWVELSDFDGIPRSDAVGFAIGSKGYLGTGYTGENRMADFWEYDPVRNTWTQKAEFPGVARNAAIGFGTSTKGYKGTGSTVKNRYNDFYEYEPVENTGQGRLISEDLQDTGQFAMSMNNKGYWEQGMTSQLTLRIFGSMILILTPGRRKPVMAEASAGMQQLLW